MRAQVAGLEAQRREQLPVCGSAAHATLARPITFHATPHLPPLRSDRSTPPLHTNPTGRERGLESTVEPVPNQSRMPAWTQAVPTSDNTGTGRFAERSVPSTAANITLASRPRRVCHSPTLATRDRHSCPPQPPLLPGDAPASTTAGTAIPSFFSKPAEAPKPAEEPKPAEVPKPTTEPPKSSPFSSGASKPVEKPAASPFLFGAPTTAPASTPATTPTPTSAPAPTPSPFLFAFSFGLPVTTPLPAPSVTETPKNPFDFSAAATPAQVEVPKKNPFDFSSAAAPSTVSCPQTLRTPGIWPRSLP
ncbi:hypothetical protein RSOL_248650, partial [Rhizoctonia solani AG-3 Rhs1AP]